MIFFQTCYNTIWTNGDKKIQMAFNMKNLKVLSVDNFWLLHDV